MPQESIKLTKDSIQSSLDLKKSENASSCRLFGVDLKIAPKGDIIPEVAPSIETYNSAGISEQKSDPASTNHKGSQSKQTTLSRSRTKVHLLRSDFSKIKYVYGHIGSQGIDIMFFNYTQSSFLKRACFETCHFSTGKNVIFERSQNMSKQRAGLTHTTFLFVLKYMINSIVMITEF